MEAPSDGQSPKRARVVIEIDSEDDDVEVVDHKSSGDQKSAAGTALPILPYYLGAVRGLSQTFNEQCLALEDVFSGEWHKGILMNFMVDLDWMCETLPRLRSVPWLCVYDAKGGLEGQKSENQNFFMPRLDGPFLFGTHHSKMALLWYREGLRVVVCTANYIEIDWRNKTEGIWVQDFPYIAEGAPEVECTFGKDLIDYVRKLNGFENGAAPPGVRRGHAKLDDALGELRRVDFRAAQAVLIPSVAGKHTGNDFHRYGHLKLRRVLETEGVEACFNPSVAGKAACGVVSQFSSMGSHAKDGKWVKEEFEASLKAGSSSKEAAQLTSYVVWPRMDDVRNSIEGWSAGGAMPCQPKNVFDDKEINPIFSRNTIKPYLRERLSLFQADRWGRHRAMPHLKSFLRFVVPPSTSGSSSFTAGSSSSSSSAGGVAASSEQGPRLAWAMIASQNYSKVAWGEIMDKGRVFKIQSFEMGVLFLPSRFRRLSSRPFSCTPTHPLLGLASPGHTDVTAFVSATCQSAKTITPGMLPIPVPFTLPPPRYNFTTDQPWVSHMPSEERDTFGYRKVLIGDHTRIMA